MSPHPPIAERTIRARWTWHRGRFIEGLRVTTQGDRIVQISSEPQPDEERRDDWLLLPGLVNAHTHLEFSGLSQPVPHAGTFASWIRAVVHWRRQQNDASHLSALRQGLEESTAAGVAAIGEIATRSTSCDLYSTDPFQVVFREALGLSATAVAGQLEQARSHLSSTRNGARQRPGLSPHAPYSLHRDLFQGIVDLAKSQACPLAMHLAETEEELELLSSGTGPFAELFSEWGLWKVGQPAPFRDPLEVLRSLEPLPNVLVIHGNYLTPREHDFLAGKENFTVVYCPRTHSYFGHRPYPLSELLRRRVRVALGTDSRASNPDLNVLLDLRHAVRQHPEVAPTAWIEMVTSHGAAALGQNEQYGAIEIGYPAKFCKLTIPAGMTDPLETVLDSGAVHSST
jgi:cytosine/adenosine deaminase-related metal-dependent hydrolase